MKKTMSALLLLTCLSTPACVGPYNAFNAISSWNSRVSDSRWLNELLFLGMWIIPVYPIALTIDGLIFNSIEFWGGENPIKEPEKFENQSKK
jgi:hypothetical protein